MEDNFQILDAADEDIGNAIEHYEEVRNGLSIDFELCLEEGYGDIINTPFAYQIRYGDVRVKFIRRFPYGIHYVVDKSIITVIAIFHQSKNPRKWSKRRKEM